MNNVVIVLARLYDATAHELQQALMSQTITFNDSRIKDKVIWLGEIAKTLSLVYQIENLRAKAKDSKGAVELPPEKVVQDPALKKAKNVGGSGQFSQGNSESDLSQFGNWSP